MNTKQNLVNYVNLSFRKQSKTVNQTPEWDTSYITSVFHDWWPNNLLIPSHFHKPTDKHLFHQYDILLPQVPCNTTFFVIYSVIQEVFLSQLVLGSLLHETSKEITIKKTWFLNNETSLDMSLLQEKYK